MYVMKKTSECQVSRSFMPEFLSGLQKYTVTISNHIVKDKLKYNAFLVSYFGLWN